MRSNNVHTFKKSLAKLMVAVMVILSVVVIQPTTAKAGSAPTLTKSTRTILEGKRYNINIKNKVKLSTYKWTTSDKMIATVTQKGIVKGVSKGVATITCKVTTPKTTYDLTCKVTIRESATVFKVSNKITALNLGQKYNLNRSLTPSTSNDLTTWTSSDTTIASPDARGNFVALKVGTVTITGKTLSGATDSMTFTVVDKEGTVTNQAELAALVGSGAALITIKTNEAVNFTIPSGTYTNQKLIVDAPKSDVTNAGVFASIEIKQIKSNTWYEQAIGNLLNILALDSRIVVGSGASVTIEVSEAGAVLRVENNGIVTELVMNKESDVDISGTSTQEIPVTINVPNITIKTSVPLNLDCNEKIALTLLPGSEKTQIHAETSADVPAISGNITVKVSVGEGSSATEVSVVGTPVPTAAPAPSGGSGGAPSGGSGVDAGGGSSIGTVAVVNNSNGTVSYVLSKPYTDLTAISVRYNTVTYSVTSGMLATVKLLLQSEALTVQVWKGTTDITQAVGEQTYNVSGTAGSSMKTVSYVGGQLDGKSYDVTMNDDGSVTIKSTSTNSTFTVSKSSDNKTLTISAATPGLVFTPTF
ncbi:MAG: Ig-like domain-containing protein [Mobilitalea sp.]